MKRIVHFFMIGALSLTIAACGKTDREKAQDSAKSDVAEFNSIDHELAGEFPTAAWSVARIDAYSAKLNRYEELYGKLQAQNGRDGVEITHLVPEREFRSTIASGRAMIAGIRAASALRETFVGVTDAKSGTSELMKEYSVLEGSLAAETPAKAWSAQRLDAYSTKLDRYDSLDQTLRAMSSKPGVNARFDRSRAEVLAFIKGRRSAIAGARLRAGPTTAIFAELDAQLAPAAL